MMTAKQQVLVSGFHILSAIRKLHSEATLNNIAINVAEQTNVDIRLVRKIVQEYIQDKLQSGFMIMTKGIFFIKGELPSTSNGVCGTKIDKGQAEDTSFKRKRMIETGLYNSDVSAFVPLKRSRS